MSLSLPLRRRVLVLLIGLPIAACAPRLLKLPDGPGAPASDIRDAVADATAACKAVSTLTAEIGVSGSVGGRRVRARLLAGLASPSSARIEAFAFGTQIFIFAARGNDATLLLTRDHRVLEHGRPDAVLEAVAGLPLDAADLRVALLGCAVAPDLERGRRFGERWRAVPDGARQLYLENIPSGGSWRIVAVVHPDWRAEYRTFERNLPRSVRLVSTDRRRFDLRLELSQVDLNVKLEDAAFRIPIPPGTDPISLEELRQSGPLAGTTATE